MLFSFWRRDFEGADGGRRNGRMGGRRVRGEYRFEFARGGEGEGKGGVKGLGMGGGWGYRFSSLLKQNKKAKICFVIYIAGFFF